MTTECKRRLCVAVYTPMIGGLYYSELVTQIMQICEIKKHKVKIVHTGGYGKFNSKLGLEEVDIVIILRSAVHTTWVKEVRDLGKAVVSIAYDYFPLDVPVINSDHAFGIKLAFEELFNSGCKKLAFVGNINNYDIRKRYEAFCEYSEDLKLTVDEADIIPVSEDLLGGGFEGAIEFIKRRSSADGIIFGTTMNAIGFSKYINESEENSFDRLTLIGFDANSMVPVLQPGISAIDLNLNLMAHKSISIGEAILRKEVVEKRINVQPKLISSESEIFNCGEAYMATSTEAAVLSDPNYMKCVTYNMQEWVSIIAKSNLEKIMVLRPLFRGDLEKLTFGRFVKGGGNRSHFKLLKTIDRENVIVHTPQDKDSLFLEESFGENAANGNEFNYDKVLHLMIDRGDEHWGVVSVYGLYKAGAVKSSYLLMVMYLEWIICYLKPNTAGKQVENSQKTTSLTKSNREKLSGKIQWEVNSNTYIWDDTALKILGFESNLDKGIYANMELTDRLLEADIPSLRSSLQEIELSAFSISIHYRHRNRSYVACELSSVDSKSNKIEFMLVMT